MADAKTLLKEGVKAIRAGDRARGRDLLMDAVDQDQSLELAWLWLGLVMETPEDCMVALENALAINPYNQQAREQLEKLQAAYATPVEKALADTANVAYQATVPAAEQRFADTAPNLEMSVADDMHQCIYCGYLTHIDDRKCPQCKKALIDYREGKRPALVGWLLTLLSATVVVLAVFAGAVAVMAWGEPTSLTTTLAGFDLITDLFGDFLTWPDWAVQVVLVVSALRVVAVFTLIVGWSLREEFPFYVAPVVFPLDLILGAILFMQGYMGNLVFWPLIVLDPACLLMTIYSNMAKKGRPKRALLQVSHKTKMPKQLYKQGVRYMKEGKWALATLYFQQATVYDTAQLAYFYHLGLGYAELGRFARAAMAMREAHRLDPNNVRIEALLDVYNQRAQESAKTSS